MSVRRLDQTQPDNFEFSKENLIWAEELIQKYPEGKQRSAVIPLLWRAQEQDGWTSEPAIRKVADMLDMSYIRVYEVATFYTMFQLSPVGSKAHIQVCGTTPCMLRGAQDLIDLCKKRIASEPHTLSEDGRFSWEEVECLGACVNAPMIQVFKDTYEDLDAESLNIILDAFDKGETPKPGPQNGRDLSSPQGGATTLDNVPAYEPLNLQNGAEHKTSASKEESSQSKELAASENITLTQPPSLEGPRGGTPDDLKRIKGIGATLEEKLNKLGFYHFDQIAAWTDENIAWIDEHLSFKGRVEREKWLPQAKTLSEGGETEFSKRVDSGEVETSKSDGEA